MSKKAFQVQVNVIEALDLKGKDSSGMSDPVCIVQVGKQKQNTKTFHATTSAAWDEFFIFELKVKEEDFRKESVAIRVFDANSIMRNVLIGEYAMGLATVRAMPNHEIYRKWLGMIDPTNPGEGVQGYLKASVTVLGPGDEAPVHGDDDEEDAKTGKSLEHAVMMPPAVKMEGKQLLVNVYRAEHLPKMDVRGTIDPFVNVTFAGQEARTMFVPQNQNPTWDSSLRLPLWLPNMADVIDIGLWDHDDTSGDDYVARAELSVSAVLEKVISPRWFNMYMHHRGTLRQQIAGAGKEKTSAQTMYAGRVLMAVSCKPNEKPITEVLPVEGAPPQAPAIEPRTLNLDILMASGLETAPGEKLQVKLTIGPHVVKSQYQSSKGCLTLWHEKLQLREIALPKDIDQIPSCCLEVHVKGVTGKARLGYVLYKAADLVANGFKSLKPSWVPLLADEDSVAHKEDRIPGFLLMNLGLGPEKAIPDALKAAPTPPPLQPMQLRINLYQAKHLAAADPNGLSDPFVIVMCGGKKVKSEIKERTLFPAWYKTLVLDVDLPADRSLGSNVVVMVMDYDRMSANDLLGHFQLDTSTLTSAWPGDPKWEQLYVTDPDTPEGELLCSFQLLTAEEAKAQPVPEITPRTEDCVVEFSLVGLRELAPGGFLPPAKPYIEVDAPGVKAQRSESSSVPAPASPNMLEVMLFTVPLPLNPLYTPFLNVRVFDDRLGKDPLIGTTAIDLAPFMPWSDNRDVKSADLPPVVDDIPGAGADEEVAAGSGGGGAPVVVPPGGAIEMGQVSITVAKTDPRDMPPEAGTGERTLPEVAETVLPGMEPAEPDEEEALSKLQKELKHELEHHMKKPPFLQWQLQLGQTRGLSRAERLRGGTIKKTGRVKGNVRCWPSSSEPPTPTPNLREMFKPKNYMARVYVTRGMQMVPKDSGGTSDPYLVLSTGTRAKDILSDDRNIKKKTLRPEWFKCYELPVTLPGNSQLKITAMDWDMLDADDLIGSTSIDLEDRQFNDEWKQLKTKPKEIRTLWSPISSCPQGKIEMWLEILTEAEAKKKPPKNISPPKPSPFELRVIVWCCRDVVFKDKEGSEAPSSDIFVTCEIDGSARQSTDVHWNSKNGEGNFNWRMVFPVTLPMKLPRLKVAIWDRDLIGADDAIGESIINLSGMFKKAFKKREGQDLGKAQVDVFHPNATGKQGTVEFSVEVMTAEEAAGKAAGKGREEPNQWPELSEPIRPEDSFPPWAIDKQAAQLGKKLDKAFTNKILKKYWWVLVLIVLILVGVVIGMFCNTFGCSSGGGGDEEE